jgi:hypothetical protein
MKYLRYGTTTYVKLGPFVDQATGTSMTTNALSTAADSAFLYKHGSTVATTMQALTAWSSVEAGYMLYPVTTGETDTVGPLEIDMIDEDLFLPVHHEYSVISQELFDGMFSSGSTTVIPVNVTQANGSTVQGSGVSTDKWRG